MMTLKSFFIAHVALLSLVSLCTCDNPAGFTVDLIHRDSPQSPSYDPSLSQYQRLANALQRSFDRVRRFNSIAASNGSPQPDITKASGEYFISYSVGTPPVAALGLADTGNDFTWTQCEPCPICFNQKLPLFKPNTSSTYKKIPCNNPQCTSLKETSCSKANNNCLYSKRYGNGSSSLGELATDTITLASSDGKTVSAPNVVFGCGFENSLFSASGESGIVGLGAGKVSMVRQLGPLAQGKFSYCLVSLSAQSSSSKLNFGANAAVAGTGAVSTPLGLTGNDPFYYLTLEGINVGNQRLNVDGAAAKGNNMIIDSGTTLMLLPASLYNKLEAAIKSSIKLKQIPDPKGVLSLCYLSKTDINIPDIVVHFKGADVKLKQDNIFARVSDDALCLAARAVEPGQLAVYGNLAQVNFLVGYDLDKKTVSFKPTVCAK